MKFYKYHGTGNDFILIEDLNEKIVLSQNNIRNICQRHYGIGADGLIMVRTSEIADYKMVYFNADGTQAEMCGNGIRCFAKFLDDIGKVANDFLKVETLSGIKELKLFSKEGTLNEIEVNMGRPLFKSEDIPFNIKLEKIIDYSLKINNETYLISLVSMGNPHCIIEVDNIDLVDINTLGPKIENHKLFPKKTNVEFIKIISDNEILMRVWERGVGETLACGTGACAAAVVSNLKGKSGEKVRVNLPGGKLNINWIEGNDVYLRGPAVRIFSGDIPIK